MVVMMRGLRSGSSTVPAGDVITVSADVSHINGAGHILSEAEKLIHLLTLEIVL
jgi:hypothetical protein